MTFHTELATIPTHTTQPDAAGFLPPFARATGHLMFLLADSANQDHALLDDTAALTELTNAQTHWAAMNSLGALSDPTLALLTRFDRLLLAAIDEFPTWTPEARTHNLRNVANALVDLCVILDRELLGLRDSDAGFNL